MDQALDKLIDRYVETAAHLFPRVAKHLGVSIPITNLDWAVLDVPQRGQTKDGVRYFIHGYGVAMNDGSCRIDMDLGENGEINGFDAWRLFEFARENKVETPFKSHSEIESAIKDAVQSAELRYSGYILYYRK